MKLNLLGQRFGRLTVISEEPSKNRHSRWRCLCDCGNVKIADGPALRAGSVKSCGCLQKDRVREANTTHGERGTRIYHIWEGMKRRCYRKSTTHFERWGGRGIAVCNEWHTYEPFRDWALANGYRDDLTIDRIDVNGDYSPENCRWATYKEQNRNRRSNVFYKGKCLAEWCEEIGISLGTVSCRIRKSGWSIEKALFTPIRAKRNNHEIV